MVVRARCVVAGDGVVLVGIRHVGIRCARHPSLDGDRYAGGYDLIDDAIDHHLEHDNLGATIDNHLDYGRLDNDLDHDDSGSIVGDGNSCHWPVGARTRHHRLSHG